MSGPLPEWYQLVMDLKVSVARLEEKVDALGERFTRHLGYHQQEHNNGLKKIAILGLSIGAGMSGAGGAILKLLGVL